MASTRKEIREIILETLGIKGRTYWELAGEVFVKYNSTRDKERWLGWSDYLGVLSGALDLKHVLTKEQSDGERKGSIIYSLGESMVIIGTA